MSNGTKADTGTLEKTTLAESIELYKEAYLEAMENTHCTTMTWDRRRFEASEYAAYVCPEIADAVSKVMGYRRAVNDGPSPQPFSKAVMEALNGLVGWKANVKYLMAKKKYGENQSEPESPTESDETEIEQFQTTNGATLYVPRGYIVHWYRQWFNESENLHARDKELASALNCTSSAFRFARKRLVEQGYQFEHKKNGRTTLVSRPDDKHREKIGKLESYLESLGLELERAKEELATLKA